MEFIKDKHEIEIREDDIILSPGELHIRKCDDDYNAYLTY